MFNELKITREFSLQKLRANKAEAINFIKMQTGSIRKIQAITGEYPRIGKSSRRLLTAFCDLRSTHWPQSQRAAISGVRQGETTFLPADPGKNCL